MCVCKNLLQGGCSAHRHTPEVPTYTLSKKLSSIVMIIISKNARRRLSVPVKNGNISFRGSGAAGLTSQHAGCESYLRVLVWIIVKSFLKFIFASFLKQRSWTLVDLWSLLSVTRLKRLWPVQPKKDFFIRFCKNKTTTDWHEKQGLGERFYVYLHFVNKTKVRDALV